MIFTDGNYNNKGSVLQLIRNLRNKNTRIVSVAVGGKHANQDNIDALALSSSDVYDMDVMDAVTFLDDMAPTTCKIATCTAGRPASVSIIWSW